MELVEEEKRRWSTLLDCDGWPLYEEILMVGMNQRVEAVLLKTNLTEKEREYLRGELSFGMYAVSLPKEMIASAEAGLELLYQQRVQDEESETEMEDDDDVDTWRID